MWGKAHTHTYTHTRTHTKQTHKKPQERLQKTKKCLFNRHKILSHLSIYLLNIRYEKKTKQ